MYLACVSQKNIGFNVLRAGQLLPNTAARHIDCSDTLDLFFDENTSFYFEKNTYILAEGLLYNAKDICQSDSLSEIIFTAYKKWNISFLEHIDGKFSFVIIDTSDNRVFGAVDRFGEMKLSYSVFDGAAVFSTSVRALACITGNNAISANALGMYFAHNYISAPYTIYENIFKARPGESIELVLSRQPVKKMYWRPLKKEISTDISLEDAKHNAICSFKNSIQKRWDAENHSKAALFLSGGIDSSLLCEVLCEMDEIPLTAYTASFKAAGAQYDESETAKYVAEACGVEYKVIEIEIDLLKNEIYSILGESDEPMANRTYSVATILMREAAKECDCLFTGDGGDEVFWGYPQYQRIVAAQKLYKALRPFARMLLSNAIKKRLPGKLVSILEAGTDIPAAQLFSSNSVKLAKRAVLNVHGSLAYEDAPEDPRWFVQKNRIDLLYGTQAAIRKWNDVSQNNGMRHFSPILDPEILSFADTLPEKYKMNRRNNKILLRSIVNEKTPEISRLPKHGFSIPTADWLRGSFKSILDEITEKRYVVGQGLFDFGEVDCQKQRFLAGKTNFANDAEQFIWNYFVFQAWYRNAMEKNME